jgi:uncharacterized protein YjiS (DUF1127 family)
MQKEKTFSATPARQAQAWRSSIDRLTIAWNRLQSSFEAWRCERAAIVELATLADWELRDIGLDRSQIAYVVKSGWSHGVGARACARGGSPMQGRAPEKSSAPSKHESPARGTAKDMRV